MKIGILRCGHVRDEYAATHGQYADMFESLFKNAHSELDYSIYNVMEHVYPGSLDECDAYITTGSKSSVYDNEEWIGRFREFIQALHESEKKLVGICFGHQMIATALGGKTDRSSYGWGVGSKLIDIVEPQPWMNPRQSTYKIFVSHQDQVLRLPEQAVRVGTADYCPNSMFVIGTHILAMQGHPEFTAEYSYDLARARIDSIGEATYRDAEPSFTQAADQQLIADWILNFLEY